MGALWCTWTAGATSQKPRAVIEALVRFYERCNANVHRGPHRLAQEAAAHRLTYEALKGYADFLMATLDYFEVYMYALQCAHG
jgi:selenocysteine lyase/cysteine desulfurase